MICRFVQRFVMIGGFGCQGLPKGSKFLEATREIFTEGLDA